MTDWTTRVLHPSAEPPEGFRSLVTPVFRGSTTLFPNAASLDNDWHQEQGYTYGLRGTPTTRDLSLRVAELEGGWRTFITPGGQLRSR